MQQDAERDISDRSGIVEGGLDLEERFYEGQALWVAVLLMGLVFVFKMLQSYLLYILVIWKMQGTEFACYGSML